MTTPDVVFLFDVDNTLLDNDGVEKDLQRQSFRGEDHLHLILEKAQTIKAQTSKLVVRRAVVPFIFHLSMPQYTGFSLWKWGLYLIQFSAGMRNHSERTSTGHLEVIT